jgi:hypothetical protein
VLQGTIIPNISDPSSGPGQHPGLSCRVLTPNTAFVIHKSHLPEHEWLFSQTLLLDFGSSARYAITIFILGIAYTPNQDPDLKSTWTSRTIKRHDLSKLNLGRGHVHANNLNPGPTVPHACCHTMPLTYMSPFHPAPFLHTTLRRRNTSCHTAPPLLPSPCPLVPRGNTSHGYIPLTRASASSCLASAPL